VAWLTLRCLFSAGRRGGLTDRPTNVLAADVGDKVDLRGSSLSLLLSGMSRVTLRFPPALEDEYRSFVNVASVGHVRKLLVLIALVFGGFVMYDLTSNLVVHKGVVIAVRLGGVVGSIAVMLVLMKFLPQDVLLRWLEVFTFCGMLVCGGFIVFMHGFNENQTADPANLMVSGMLPRAAVSCCITVTVAYVWGVSKLDALLSDFLLVENEVPVGRRGCFGHRGFVHDCTRKCSATAVRRAGRLEPGCEVLQNLPRVGRLVRPYFLRRYSRRLYSASTYSSLRSTFGLQWCWAARSRTSRNGGSARTSCSAESWEGTSGHHVQPGHACHGGAASRPTRLRSPMLLHLRLRRRRRK
jgi:hypothetical protein